MANENEQQLKWNIQISLFDMNFVSTLSLHSEPGIQFLLTFFRLLLGERGEEPFNLIKTASCHMLP